MNQGAEEDKEAPLLDHIIELRNRLVYSVIALLVGFVVCVSVASYIFEFLTAPLARALGDEAGRRMIFTALYEPFFVYIKIGIYAGLFLAFPVISNQLWRFVAPGLYRREKQAFLPYLAATPILFFAGGAMVYYAVMPLAWEFFVTFETPGAPGAEGEVGTLPIQLEAKVSEYLSLVIKLMFAFGLFFQMPVGITLVVRAGIVSADQLARGRKYAVVVVFLTAAVLTPPDIISQVGLALPGLVLYEISIVLARRIERRRARAEAEADAEEEAEG